MTYNHFVNNVARAAGYSQRDTKVLLDTCWDYMREMFLKSEEVNIPGLAKFGTKIAPARVAKNFQTGETITVPSHERPFCKFSKSVRDSLKDGN